jgi:hypothetical protein
MTQVNDKERVRLKVVGNIHDNSLNQVLGAGLSYFILQFIPGLLSRFWCLERPLALRGVLKLVKMTLQSESRQSLL